MKKEYTSPIIDIKLLENEDIITTSGNQNKIFGGRLAGDLESPWDTI